jgi:hypothetical protein
MNLLRFISLGFLYTLLINALRRTQRLDRNCAASKEV